MGFDCFRLSCLSGSLLFYALSIIFGQWVEKDTYFLKLNPGHKFDEKSQILPKYQEYTRITYSSDFFFMWLQH